MTSAEKDMPSAELVVYTCIVGGYDKLRPLSQVEPGVSYICFTEPDTTLADPWVRRDLSMPADGRIDRHSINRFHKLFPQRLFPGHQYSIYQDGNVSFQGSYLDVLKKFRSTAAAIGAFRHFANRTVESEAQACRDCGKFTKNDLRVIDQQLADYRLQGYPMREMISANYFLVRNHYAPTLDATMEAIWQDLARFTSRDQISLPFHVWSNKADLVFLDDLGIPLELAQRCLHRNEFLLERLPRYIRRRFNRCVRALRRDGI